MSDDTEEQKVCQTCYDFEPQTWRKSLCKNCFHSLEEHSPELLAHEAEVVAKEKAAIKATETGSDQTGPKPDSGKSTDQSNEEDKSKESSNETTTEKSDAAKKVKRKYGAERAAAEGGGAWSWAIDLGREYSKPDKPAEAAKTVAPPSTTAAPPSSTKPPSQLSTKPPAKPPSTVEQPSSSSTPATSDTTPVSMSKAKNVASKFESKSQTLPKTKPTTRPPEIRPGSASVAALTGKLTDQASGTKIQPKTTDPQKLPFSKLDSKDPKSSEAPSTLPRNFSVTAKDSTAVTKKPGRTSLPAGKLDDKSSSGQTKVAPFGKDLLRSVRDSPKREMSTLSSSEKLESLGKTEHSSSSITKLESSDRGEGATKGSSDASVGKSESSPVASVGKSESSPVASVGKSESSPVASVGKSESSPVASVGKSESSPVASVGKSESSPVASVEKTKNSTVAFVGEHKHSSAISLGHETSFPEVKGCEAIEGKEPVEIVAAEELSLLVPEKESSPAASRSGAEKVTREGKLDADVETVPAAVKLSEVGQRSPRVENSLAENYGYLARDPEHAQEGIVCQSGHLANFTGSSSGERTVEDSGIKERVQLATDKDDVTVQGQDGKEAALRTPPSSKPHAPGLSQEPGTVEVARVEAASEDATSISSSPSEAQAAAPAATSTSQSPTSSSDLHLAQAVLSSTPSLPEDGLSRYLQPDAAKECKSGQSLSDLSNAQVDNEDTQLPVSLPTSSLVTTPEQKDESRVTTPDQKDESLVTTPEQKEESRVTTPEQKDESLVTTPEQKDESHSGNTKEDAKEESVDDEVKRLSRELNEKDRELSILATQLSSMEEQVRALEEERDQCMRTSVQTQKDDLEALLDELRSQLAKMEVQCSRLESDNQTLIDKLRVQEAKVKQDQESRGKTSDNTVLEEDLEAAERELEEVKDDNKELQSHIMEMKNEMDEMYDHFRENEHDEFRELEKELDITAKNCRILQFKLRKAERRNEQIEQDRLVYEDKLRVLQDQFDSQDAKNHIRLLEDELRMAKEVSVRLHDELDLLEDKKNKALEESRHLTELLEHTDKRQFRMEMEIDKLRDVVSDLKQQLKEAKSGNKESTPDRKPPLGVVGKQGSREYDVSQLMKDLYDSMERENDLKDQLKFTEEEAKMMRRRVSEMDEENENLRLQLQKMSEKASKHKKKEKERLKELEEERRHSEFYRTGLSAQSSQDENREDMSSDVILIVGPEDSDTLNGDELVRVSQRKDSTDEDLMNVLQMRVQLEMLEHELMSSHQKLDEMDLENENMQAEIKFLQERLAEKETSGSLPEPSTPNAYYEDKLKEMSQEADELRWKLIEKDRELERMSVVQTRHGRDHGHKKGDKLKKSKSLEEADVMQADLRKQLEQAHADIVRLKKSVEELTERNKELADENDEFKNKTPIPSVQADDAAVENIELKENLRKMEETGRAQVEKIKSLTESLQKLARDNRSYASIATSPTAPGTLSIPGIPLVGPGTQAARAGLELPNPGDDSNTRDLHAQLHVLERENEELRGLMAAGGATCTGSTGTTQTSTAAATAQHNPASSNPVLAKSHTKTQQHGEKLTSESDDLSTSESKPDSTTSLNADRRVVTDRASESELVSPSSVMEVKNPAANSGSSKSDGRTSKDAVDDKKSDDGGKGEVEKDKSPKGKDSGKDEPLKSVLLEYPEGKSKVVISGTESRVELMEKVLEMDDEIGDLLSMLRKREEESDRMKRDLKYLNSQLRQLKDESRRTELDLLQELDMMHDKNSVMSNLLDIINERAEAAEEELERRMQEDPSHSPARSASNVSQVSALSDTSVGSDEVFLTAFVSKEGVITRDWESKLKVRIESLERLLAEERQKVSTAEKKLLLAGIDSVSPSVSDDVKLRIREKELLQEELLKSQRHLHIATDQINGLKARVHLLEDEHARLKVDYAKLYDEIDKTVDKQDGSDQNASDSEKASEEKSEEVPFVAKRISVVEAPKFRDLNRATDDTDGANEKVSKLEQELQRYKQIAKELEYKVEEIDDIWRSKSSASEKERDELDKQVREKVQEISLLEKDIENLKLELSTKDKTVASKDASLTEKTREIARLTEVVESRDRDQRKLEQERDNLSGQITQRDITIKGLNDTLRIRDERLKEKDDMLFKLNTSIEQQKNEMSSLTDQITTLSGQPPEQASMVSQSDVSSSSVLGRDMRRECQTDVEKECFRLKEAVKKLQGELDKVVGDKRALESSLEKSRRSLDEAMLMWDKDRNSLQRDANILEEKVRLYEAFNSMNKDETVETLKTESQGYFIEKEALRCELSSLKLKHEANERVHKEQVAKLQAELTDKLRLLKTEVDINSHINTEMNRLKRQAEMAYRLQQDQRVFKAENLAMKVRYETRIDKLSKEHNKMMLTIDKLQKERDMDKQIIDSIQRNMELLKDSYTEELLHSQENKAALRKYVKEIEELRLHLDELQRHTRDLRDKTIDQERLRSDMINKFATDRSSWEIDRATLNSQINQLEEKMYSTSRQQERSKDIQVNMGMAWEKERREQQRLLSEAHTLALDLQDQLRSRDEAFAHERKELLRQMETERVAWAKEKREAENEASEMKIALRKVAALEKRLRDVQEKAEKDVAAWRKEKADLLTLGAETKHAHARDTRKVENVLSRLIRLRELGMMLTSQPKWDSLEEKPPDRPENTDQSIIDYVKEVVLQICQVVDDLILLTNPASDEEAIKRISSSEIDLLKQQFSQLHHEADNTVVVADISTSSVVTKSRVEEKSAGVSRRLPNDAILSVGPDQPHTTAFSETTTKYSNRAVLTSPYSRQELPPSILIPTTQPTLSSTTVMRPGDASSRHNPRPPSYASGTRSAQTSRATTPEVPDSTLEPSYAPTSKKVGFTEPVSSYSIPRYNIFQTHKQKSTTLPPPASSKDKSAPRRPVTFMKSLSMDSASILDSPPDSRGGHQPTSLSASNTPTQPTTSAEMASLFSTAPVITSTSNQHLSVSRESSSRHSSTASDKVSPRTARRMFFDTHPSSQTSFPAPLGYQSWPERRTMTPTLHFRQTSLPDPEEVRREAEEEHDIVSSKLESRGRYSVMKSSTSWDEQMLRQDVAPEGAYPSTSSSHDTLAEGISQSSTEEHQPGSKQPTIKEKRRLFKKSSSVDSSVGSSIAKVGVAVMNPGAPTGFAPSDLFSAFKGKLKPVFKKKSAAAAAPTNQARSPSPLFIQTDVPEVHFAGHGATLLPVPVPPVDVATLPACDQPEPDELVSDFPDERSRNSQRNDVPRGKWRSKSADRAQAPLNIRADVVRTAPGVWQFNETAV